MLRVTCASRHGLKERLPLSCMQADLDMHVLAKSVYPDHMELEQR